MALSLLLLYLLQWCLLWDFQCTLLPLPMKWDYNYMQNNMCNIEVLIDIYGLWQIVDNWHNKNKQKWWVCYRCIWKYCLDQCDWIIDIFRWYYVLKHSAEGKFDVSWELLPQIKTEMLRTEWGWVSLNKPCKGKNSQYYSCEPQVAEHLNIC